MTLNKHTRGLIAVGAIWALAGMSWLFPSVIVPLAIIFLMAYFSVCVYGIVTLW